VLTDPVEDLREAEFVSVHRSVDKRVSVQAFDLASLQACLGATWADITVERERIPHDDINRAYV